MWNPMRSPVVNRSRFGASRDPRLGHSLLGAVIDG
jgi:hypothetical protein